MNRINRTLGGVTVRSFVAVMAAVRFDGGFSQCIRWAVQAESESGHEVSIYTCRGGERNAGLLGVVSRGRFWRHPGGRYVPVRKLPRRACG